ncbi:MAG: hypothetical protein CME80_08550 [Halomonas sp.]|nr:hypothetical protein [Halomonas sp.]
MRQSQKRIKESILTLFWLESIVISQRNDRRHPMYKTQTRMPDELAEWLKHSAKENHRSMNAQLVHLLERCKRNENEKPAA